MPISISLSRGIKLSNLCFGRDRKRHRDVPIFRWTSQTSFFFLPPSAVRPVLCASLKKLLAAIDSTDDDVMHRARRIDASFAWHTILLFKKNSYIHMSRMSLIFLVVIESSIMLLSQYIKDIS
jgi:hypothetical protein